MIQRILLVGLICIAGGIRLVGESVIPPNFAGHLTRSEAAVPGDVLLIEIHQDVQFSVTSTRSSSNSRVFELSGGEGGSLLSFLPSTESSSSMSLQSEESVSFSTVLPVMVTSIDEFGNADISGSRTMEMEGGRQEISLRGSISPDFITPGTAIPISRVLNTRFTYTTLSTISDPVFSELDFEEMEEEPTPVGEAAPLAEGLPPEGLEPEGLEDAETPAVGEALGDGGLALPGPEAGAAEAFTLTDEKKRELFIQYINEFMRLMFD